MHETRAMHRWGGWQGAAIALLLVSAVPSLAQSAADSAVQSLAAVPAADTTRPVVPDAGPVWDIDVHSYETHERVQHFVGLFLAGTVRDEFAKRSPAPDALRSAHPPEAA